MISLSWDVRRHYRLYDPDVEPPPGGWSIEQIEGSGYEDEFVSVNQEALGPYDDWWEFVVDFWKEKLEAFGVTDVEVEFSGFWSQGDGASFTGYVDATTFINKMRLRADFGMLMYFIEMGGEFSVRFNRTSSHYSHSRTVTTHVDFDYYLEDLVEWGINREVLDRQAERLEEIIEEWRDDICHDIYRDLEKEYEYLSSWEAFKESAEENDYRFDEDLKLT